MPPSLDAAVVRPVVASGAMPQVSRVRVRYEAARMNEDWVLLEEPVPESSPHDMLSDTLKYLLLAWAAREARRVKIGRNLAIHWDEANPKIGVAPDVYVVEPPPPEGDQISALKLWKEGHAAPLLAIEVVSASNAAKDYQSAPYKYAASGTGELWILDPGLLGPKVDGGPYRIQVWGRNRGDDEGTLTRLHAGDGPAWSPAVGGWLFAVDEGRSIRIASDEAGTAWWMTREEAERAAKEAALRRVDAERAAKEAALRRVDAERVAKEAALRRVAELEAALGRGRS
jgi:Uma2 family endonuclease